MLLHPTLCNSLRQSKHPAPNVGRHQHSSVNANKPINDEFVPIKRVVHPDSHGATYPATPPSCYLMLPHLAHMPVEPLRAGPFYCRQERHLSLRS
ncbi:hypothetical protein BDP81DRAFT_168947 [Colletotrichum phormii]|uniref:Uncharacterized protein n=1 Tax=Colletotrichum phormii TaxID=359342 RepID=A0AAI9ZD59_9PEZI|nr:uncharacterized protein BDP81DRAFT_168947 [Colletotrichum phormii]KAK1622048.1 hypothetical protein BDP81DRAFT_168947 [Colletotrichum phormii]